MTRWSGLDRMVRRVRPAWPLLAAVLATTACGLSWQRVSLLPERYPGAYAAIQVWRHGKVTYLADSRIGKDTVKGIAANSHGSPLNDCMSDECRVAIPLADVDSIRSGSATRAQTIHALMALALVGIFLAGVNAR